MLPCVCSVKDHRRRQNVERTSVTHSAIVSCATVLFLAQFDVTCDLLSNQIMSSRFLSRDNCRTRAQPESTIMHRNQERIIELFQCKSTSRLLSLQALRKCYATLLTIHHRIDSEQRNQSENSIPDKTLVDLY